jgi:hypothetical protein
VKSAALLLLFCIVFILPVFSQENLDDLFDDPEDDIVVAETSQDHMQQFTRTPGLQWSGQFITTAGLGIGWSNIPFVLKEFSVDYGVSASTYLNFNVRPDPSFRLYGSLASSISPLGGRYTWSSFYISSLFADYILHDIFFFRLGNFSITWGQSRLPNTVIFKVDDEETYVFDTNIMSDVSSGFALRASVPTLLDGVSLIGLIKSGVSYRDIVVAAKVDKIVLETFLSLGLRYQRDEGIKILGSIKRVVYGTDLLSDIFLFYNNGNLNANVLAGFFKEWEKYEIYGEYFFRNADQNSQKLFRHDIGLVLGAKKIFGSSIDAGLKCLHTFEDNSGNITPALSFKPWKYITMVIMLPLAYGADDSLYVDSAAEDFLKRRLLFAYGIELNVRY